MKLLLSSLLLLLTFNSYSADDLESALIEESDFQALSAKMEKESLGLVLMLHAEFCHYCAQMDAEVLSPMVRGGEYDNRVFLRKLQIDEARDVIDFTGKTVEPSDISDRFGASLTPTLVFLDHQGNERVEQMVGINTIELFGAYLDIEIDKLTKSIAENPVKTENKTASTK